MLVLKINSFIFCIAGTMERSQVRLSSLLLAKKALFATTMRWASHRCPPDLLWPPATLPGAQAALYPSTSTAAHRWLPTTAGLKTRRASVKPKTTSSPTTAPSLAGTKCLLSYRFPGHDLPLLGLQGHPPERHYFQRIVFIFFLTFFLQYEGTMITPCTSPQTTRILASQVSVVL